MAGRTTSKHVRIYGSGYRLHGYTRSVGPLVWEYPAVDLTTIGDSVRGFLPGQGLISASTINSVFDNNTTSLHAIGNAGNNGCNMMIVLGDRAAPAAGDPAFMLRIRQLSYQVSDEGGAVVATCNIPAWDVYDMPAYSIPWGTLLHADGAETGANSGTGIDGLASTSTGGYMMYEVLAGNGTATISIDDSANNIAFAACSGLTTGVIDCSNPTSGIIELASTATIRQYTRWQLTLGTAGTVTFALAFARGRASV